MEKCLNIVGVGIDVVDMETISRARFKKRFAEYFLTAEELEHIPEGIKEIEFLASRFAVKEAVIKAFPMKLSPHEFIIEKKGAQPVISFFSKEYIVRYCVHISLSHSKHIATAIAVVSKSGI